MDAVATYSFANLGWLGLQSFPLVVWPSFIGSLLKDEYEHASSLETYYARSLGIALLMLGLTTVVLSGALPLTGEDSTPQGKTSPYADASILISVLHHVSTAFYCYSRFMWTKQTAFALGGIGSAVFASFGTWCIMFAGDKGRVSKKTGFDKDTSGFPFKNSESYRSKKKKGL